jgi:hypothetical protein
MDRLGNHSSGSNKRMWYVEPKRLAHVPRFRVEAELHQQTSFFLLLPFFPVETT